MTIVRFAPSPTGLLHVGNARMALVNWLHARALNGRFILRLDDTDVERSTAEFADAIGQDLKWLGLEWDQLEKQSDRFDRYREAFDKLRDMDRLYACYETPEELTFKRKRQLSAGKPPIYDRAGLTLTDQQRQDYEADGRKPHWRFKLNHSDIDWHDLVRGDVHFNGAHLSDPVLVRGDGSYLYMMPSAVDDIDMAVTDVIRGEDHVANTAVQIQLFEALDATPPTFAHVPLLTDIGGKGLSKRLGSLTVASLREDGIEPRRNLADLVRDFEISHTGRGTPKFDPDQLRAINAGVLHALDHADVSSRLAELNLEGANEKFWEAVRPNLTSFSEVVLWHRVCFGTIDPAIEDQGFITAAAELLPSDPWDQTTWKSWTDAVKEATGRKGRELFMPLRLALTGFDHGPELKFLLPLIGRDRAAHRLMDESQ